MLDYNGHFLLKYGDKTGLSTELHGGVSYIKVFRDVPKTTYLAKIISDFCKILKKILFAPKN